MSEVFCYRNLNRKGVVWSVKCWITKKVIDWAEEVYLCNVSFKVSESGRQRVLREKRKNVHAGVKGTRRLEMKEDQVWTRVSYNPYKGPYFVTEGGTIVLSCRWAKLTKDGLFISGLLGVGNEEIKISNL